MSEYTAEQVERAAGSMRVRSSDELEVERMLCAYAATLRQQTTNSPEIGSKLVGDGAVSDEATLMCAVRAHDREDAAQKGEPDPWSDELPEPYRSERLTAMRCAFQAVAPLLRAPAEQGGRVDAGSATDAQIMAEWFRADGGVHGPNVETVTMRQADYLRFRRSLCSQAALAQNAQGEPHYWLDEATMYGSKRKEFVRQIPLYLHAERARVPDRELLRRIVDAAWGEATESEQVPSVKWADKIIDSVLADATQPEDAA